MEAPTYYGVNCYDSTSPTPLRFVLDLGSNMTICFSKFFTWHDIPKEVTGTGNHHITSGQNSKKAEMQTVKDVRFNISDYEYNFEKLYVCDAVDIFMTGFVGILGCDLWQNGKIRLDYKNGIFKYEE